MVVILYNKYDKIVSDTTRPLLLFLENDKGRYKLLGRNDHVVLCFECGGIHGDPYQRIRIKKGYFSIEHFGGSGWRWTRIITFKFDSKVQNFVLHRDAGFSWHVSSPKKRTEVLYCEDDCYNVSFANYTYKAN